MTWIILIAVAIVGFGAISGVANQVEETRKKQEFGAAAGSRVEAYGAYLRRTSSNPDMARVSDAELRDFLMTSIKEYNTERNAVTTGFGFVFWIALMGAGAFGIWSASWPAFFVAAVLLVGGASVLAFRSFKGVDKKFEQRGLEPSRLKIEDT